MRGKSHRTDISCLTRISAQCFPKRMLVRDYFELGTALLYVIEYLYGYLGT
jgi:hypothetical protein